jgi:O-antigen/teichoic acid export membrane protein
LSIIEYMNPALLLATAQRWVAQLHLRQSIMRRLKNRRFWRDSSLLIAANLIVTVLGLIRTPAMVWVLPKDEIGMMGVVASWLPFIQLLSMPGMDSACYHYVAKGMPFGFIINFYYRLRWSFLSAFAFIAFAVYWGWKGDTPMAWMFLITGISYPVTIGMTASAGMLGAQQKFRGLFWYRIWEMLTDFFGFIPLILSAWWVNKVVTFYGANQLATAIFQAGVTIFILVQLRKNKTPTMLDADRREMLRYGRHLTAIGSIGVFQARTDALLVGSFSSLDTMADYSIALLVFEQLKRLWGIYVAIRYPILVRLPEGRRFVKMVKEGLLILAASSIMAVMISITGYWLLPIVLPPSYIHSLPYINWLLATFVVSIPGFMSEMYFQTAQNEKRQYALRIVSAIVGVFLPVSLVYSGGAHGVVIGRFLASLVFSLVGIALVFQSHKTSSLGKIT